MARVDQSNPFDATEYSQGDQGNVSPTPAKGKRPTDPGKTPTLLDMDETDAAKSMLRDWDQSYRDIKALLPQWKVNRARSLGYSGVKLIKRQDENRAYIPAGAVPSIAGLNKASRLRRRLRSVLFADPAMPEAMPAGDDIQEIDQAETATRILADVCSEGNLDLNLGMSDAFDLASDYGSGFLRFWVDPQGGGYVPREIQAHPDAQTEAEKDGDDLAPKDPITRYVREDGTLTDEPTEAQREWRAKLGRELLTGKNVRFLPHTVRDIWEADGLMIGVMVPWPTLLGQFPDLATLSEQEQDAMVRARPQRVEELVPISRRKFLTAAKREDSLVFVLTRYHKQSTAYPQGFYGIACGDGTMLHRGTWFDEQHAEPLDIPVTQIGQFRDEDAGPYFRGVMEMLGPGNEVRAMLLGSMLEFVDRFVVNRKIFAPVTAGYQAQQQQGPLGMVIPVLPGQVPTFEDVPDYPSFGKETLAFINEDLDDESGLQSAAQGIQESGVKSGLHAQVLVEQVNMGLSDLRENVERAYVRAWRIVQQQIRAFYSGEQQLSWLGDDGAFKVKLWTPGDLGSTKDVRIAKGSFTHLAPSAKAALAQNYAAAGFFGNLQINPQTGQPFDPVATLRFQHAVTSHVGGLLGITEDPHTLRIRRQLARWSEGPPAPAVLPPRGLVPPGQPSPNPYAASLQAIFQPLPVDEEPRVALIRAYECGRVMAGTKFGSFPDPWKVGLVQIYQAARQAAGISTAAEQAQNAQAAQQAAQQAEEAKRQHEAGLKQQELGVKQQGERLKLSAHDAKVQADLRKAELAAQAQVETERVRVAGQAELIREQAGLAAAQRPDFGPLVQQLGQREPLTVHIPPADQVIAQAVGNALTPITQELTQLRDAMRTIGQRPSSFRVVRDTRGKVQGVSAEDGPSYRVTRNEKGQVEGMEAE